MNVRRGAPLGLAAAGVVAILVIALVLPQFVNNNAPVIGGSPSPTASGTVYQPTASPSLGQSAVPTETSPAPSATAPLPPAAGVVATLGCLMTDESGTVDHYAYADGRLYVACPDGSGNYYVGAVDVATGTIVARYDVGYIRHTVLVAGGALWRWGWAGPGSGCVGDCSSNVERIDLGTGKVTTRLDHRVVLGVAGGFVFVTKEVSGKGYYAVEPGAGLEKVDPATGQVVGTVAWSWTQAKAAGGRLWGYSAPNADGTVDMTEVDPATGNSLSTFHLPGMPDWTYKGIAQVGGKTWITTQCGSGSYCFVGLGESSMEGVDPKLPLGQDDSMTISLMSDDAFYQLIRVPGSAGPWLVKLDPATWQPAAQWTLPAGTVGVVIVGGTVWSVDDIATIRKLDIKP